MVKKVGKKGGKKVVKLTDKGVIINHYLKKNEKEGLNMSYRKIAKETGCGKSTVYYYATRPKVLYEKKGQN